MLRLQRACTLRLQSAWQAWSRWNICAIAISACFYVVAVIPAQARAEMVSEQVSYDGSRSLSVTLFYPDGLSVIRGVIVFTGGQASGGSGDTRGEAGDAFWQAFGQSLGFGVMGTQFTGSYTNAANGPGEALLSVLETLGEKTNHPELTNVPLLLEGFSNGGYFSFTFSQFAPERVIAFCVNKSGFAQAPLDPPFLAVPGLLIWGSEEPPDVPTVIHQRVQEGRAQHALWAELREWDRAHEDGDVEPIFAPFFAEMVAMRYPASADPTNGVVKLNALREESGWLGDHAEDSVSSDVPLIAEFAMYPGDKAAASWLASEGLARLWRGFIAERPLELDRPAQGARIANNQALSLSLTGAPSGALQVDFFDQEDDLVENVAVSGGEASSSWDPAWGGVRGVAAVALDASGAMLRVTRPAHVVIQGKAAPMSATQDPTLDRDAGVAAGSGAGGKGGAGALGVAGKAAAGGGGARTPWAGAMAAGTGGARGSLDGGVDAALGENDLDGAIRLHDVPALRGSCDCGVGPRASTRSGSLLALALSLVSICWVRARRRSRTYSSPMAACPMARASCSPAAPAASIPSSRSCSRLAASRPIRSSTPSCSSLSTRRSCSRSWKP